MYTKIISNATFTKKINQFFDEWIFFSLSHKAKFAIKASLSLMLSYMIPLMMGWPQPSTAAITVMLIAAAGGVSESLMLGILRVIGTIIGSIIGLTLIALFPQDRFTYLVILSIIIPLILYLFHAYQGDSTVFLLVAMMIMMVFKGGEVDNSFLYGIDRTYMTIFGVVVHTTVGVFLWPDKYEDTTIKYSVKLTNAQMNFLLNTFNHEKKDDTTDVSIDELQGIEQQLEKSYLNSSESSLDVALNNKTWNSIIYSYKKMNNILVETSILNSENENLEYDKYIENHDKNCTEIIKMFKNIEDSWSTKKAIESPEQFDNKYINKDIKELSHIHRAIIANRIDALEKIYNALKKIADRLNMINGFNQNIDFDKEISIQNKFVFLDNEYLKGIIQTFLIFWFATAFWIYFNPPGGFIVVTLATLLSILTSFSPLKPSVLAVLFSLGFIFALLMYIFVLPNLVYGWQLAIFIFMYAFIGFYFVNPKMIIFFLVGLFTLGISNTMNYNFDVFLITLFLFYMFLSILMIFYYFPFSSKPEKMFLIMKRRFFKYATILLELNWTNKNKTYVEKMLFNYYKFHLIITANKLKLWGSKIDISYFNENKIENLLAFAQACESFANRLEILHENSNYHMNNKLILELKSFNKQSKIIETTNSWSMKEDYNNIEDENNLNYDKIEQRLEEFKNTLKYNTYSVDEVSKFYITLGLYHNIWLSLIQCNKHMQSISWKNLRKEKF